ncbi:glycoprotein M [Cricetid gammaherpesvirus 2]|uniref:Glycoprotein M n=1 Tax=Cricetid gammaherpesvirus 2 TaxID=1605972 RepID=E9M5M3_9GAMA|nr:glycoprotein M [Cricetid gammaherpesvirus 2]ADW24381.1 glycoprotein M [Cricetid gammaherpesvirus 2]ADW24463.1 glycoprotein M [Cricetid gammaherpesvirus 2]
MAVFKSAVISRSDSFLLRTWTNLLALLALMYASTLLVPIAASINNVGFPCYFINLVDYSNFNLTVRNSAKHLTPTLFLEPVEMYVYLTWSFIVDGLNLAYFIYAAVILYRLKATAVTNMRAIETWITLLGNHAVIFLIVAKLWTLQLFIHVLSYKHVFLAAFVYVFHFGLSYLHIHLFISRNVAQWKADDMERSLPEGTSLEKLVFIFRPIIANIQMSLLAMEMMVFSLSVMMAICNSFYMLVSDAVFGAINLLLILTIAWHISAEVFLARYLKHHVGFYVGLFVSYVIMLLPVIRYDAVFVAARLHKPITVNITIIPLICIIVIVIRIIRLRKSKPSMASVSYSKVSDSVKLRNVSHVIPSNPTPLMLDSETDDEEDFLFAK